MLKTFFIATLVVLPLAVAIGLIAYRARYFVLGVVVIVLVTMLIWAGIRVAAMMDKDALSQPREPANTPISCREPAGALPPFRCDL
jgi:hypothetical protein